MERGAKRNSEPGCRQKHPPQLLSLLLSLKRRPYPSVPVYYRCPGQRFPLICRGLSALGCWLRQHRLQVSRCSWVSLPAKRAGPEDRQLCPPKERGEVGPSPALSPSPPPGCLCPSAAATSTTLPAVNQGPGELPTRGASPPAVHATPCAQRVASRLCSEGWLR